MSQAPTPAPVSERIDLWDAAKELAVTPRQHDRSTRASARVARRSQRRFQLLLALGTLLTISGAWSFSIGLGRPSSPHAAFGFLILVVGISFMLFAAVSLLNANAFRQLSGLGRRAAPVLWWTFIVLAYLLASVCVTLSAAVLAMELSPSADVADLEYLTVALACSGVAFAAIGSSTSTPLISTMRRPRLYQAHGGQTCWTFMLVAGIVSLAPLTFRLSGLAETDVRWTILSFVVPVFVGFIAALASWHRRAIERLEENRRAIMASLRDVILRTDSPSATPEICASLRRLEVELRPSPFRSPSPAALPQPASWEICEIVGLCLWAWGEAEFPLSIAERQTHEGSHVDALRRIDRTKPELVRQSTPGFLRTIHQRLFLSAD